MSVCVCVCVCVCVLDVSTCLELIPSVHCAWHLQVVKFIRLLWKLKNPNPNPNPKLKNLDIRAAEEVFCVPRPEYSCSQEFLELAEILMEKNGLVMLSNDEVLSRLLILPFINFHCQYINWTFLMLTFS